MDSGSYHIIISHHIIFIHDLMDQNISESCCYWRVPLQLRCCFFWVGPEKCIQPRSEVAADAGKADRKRRGPKAEPKKRAKVNK